MNLPSNSRSLLAFGAFCVVAGAWVTLSAEARSRSGGTAQVEAKGGAAPSKGSGAASVPAPLARGAPELAGRAKVPPARAATVARKVVTAPDGSRSDAGPLEARAERVAAARRELELLEMQEPKNFLAVFDMMKQENRWDVKKIETARQETHAYILARTRTLEHMLRRFIDDPDGDQALEKDGLARLDDEFRGKLDSIARDIPPVANMQEMLATTTLKAPAFTEPTEPTEPTERSAEEGQPVE